MSYKVIEKNDYGIRVRNYSGIPDCNLCKNVAEKSTCKRIECAPNSYYLPDSEVEKLEYESETQKELLFLQIENKQLKDRIKSLDKYLDNRISECDYVEKEMNSDNLDTQSIIHIKNSYQNVLEFIKNQK